MKTLLTLAVTTLVACGGGKFKPPEAPGVKVGSTKTRLTSAPADGVYEATIANNTRNAFALYQQLKKPGENLFYSPHSAQMALAILYAGASGENAKAFETTFGISAPADFHQSMNQLDRDLASRGQRSRGAAGEPFALNVVNQIFIDDRLELAPAFLDLAAEQYGASGRKLDFAKQTEASRQLINTWVEQSTNDHIKDFLKTDQVTPNVLIVIANALYFSAAWKSSFEPGRTKTGTFTLADGQQSQATMMHGSASARVAQTDEYSAISLPYDGDELSFVAVMPKTFDSFEASLDGAKWQAITAALGTAATYEVTMPTFELQQRYDLIDPLKHVGLRPVFDAPNFAAMGIADLEIAFVTQQTWLKVSESGSQAAAATAIGGTRSVSLPPQFALDRPFVFAIRDNATGALLFVGRLVQPSIKID